MKRRRWLAAALGAPLGLLLTHRPEAAMTTHLYYDTLDMALFPELKVGPGRRGIHARLLRPPGDPRVPAARDAISLLVVFALDMPSGSADPGQQPPGWQLAFDATDRNGKAVQQVIRLEMRVIQGDFVEVAPPNPNLPPPTGTMLYVGAYWVDVTRLFQSRLWRPGLVVELSHGPQGQTRLTLG